MVRKALNTFGVLLFVFGVCIADSEMLILPLSFVVAGILTMYLTEKQ